MKRAAVTPVYVIAGFLGSGKTTLLKRALAHELDRGVKPAVLMNEFGEVDVGEQHLHHADTIILNKLDQMDSAHTDRVEQQIRAANPTARVLRAVLADVQVPRLLARSTSFRKTVIADGTSKDSAAGYRSGSFRITLPVDPVRLEAWLRRYARSVVRLKGFLLVAGLAECQKVQWSMGSLSITPCVGTAPSQARIVVIGRRVPWQRFLEGLERCLVQPRRKTKQWSRATRRKP